MYVGRVGIKGVVCVVGGSDATLEEATQERVLAQAKELGKRLAELQTAHLLTNGGSGVARAVSEGFYGVHPRGGIILAAVPKAKGSEGPNDFVEIPLFTHLDGDNCSHVAVSTADVVVALPGGDETLSEIELATKAKNKYQKPTVLFLADGEDTVGGKNITALKRGKYNVAENIEDVVSFVSQALSTTGR
ncbi:MAG: hypothetical protein OHK0029_04280 [Armatimonadaceae bacterium]